MIFKNSEIGYYRDMYQKWNFGHCYVWRKLVFHKKNHIPLHISITGKIKLHSAQMQSVWTILSQKVNTFHWVKYTIQTPSEYFFKALGLRQCQL